MKKTDWLRIIFLITIYLLVVYFFKKNIFSYRFNKQLINRYFLSQDIPHEVAGKRLFLSDGEIHVASGYLYVNGASPTDYNFQHPPLIKYLFGLSIVLFNNPYLVQIFFGLLLVFLTYCLGRKIIKNQNISLMASLLLIIDPIFLSLIGDPLLDLGQAVFLISYLILMIFYEKQVVLQGVVLGLLLTAKFWGGSVFFIGAIVLYLFYRKQLNIKNYLTHLFIAFLVIVIVYFKAFVNLQGRFNLIFFQLKTVKYWFHHSVSSFFGSSLILFLTGFYKTWWGKKDFIRSETWSLFWPTGFLSSLFLSTRLLIKRKININFLINILPVGYLFYLGVQAAYSRYFILILPFVYLGLGEIFLGNKKRRKD